MKKWSARKTLASMACAVLFASISTPTFAATYEVKQDDTFFKLSQERNIPLQSILAANQGVDPTNLQIGQKIQLPETKKATAVAASATAPKELGSTITTPAGKTLSFSRVISCKATGYTASAEENGGWAGVDYFGNPLKVGTIAVDPKVIPLGSTVYITGYNSPHLPGGGMVAKAADIGGAIKGERVDIFLPTNDASYFGMQNIKVYVLK
ncbi:3D domain-containing protein [Brevibacillus sp. B_LB10_24]|uniref:3D domain-containing protein n=1 Tax=Brevibacillus sp. B_LB10_24 TaxID=3380645 RepID=UPI0038BB7CDB